VTHVPPPRRCGWCGGELPSATGLGRPRQYCGQACRQRAYEHRQLTERSGLDSDAIVVSARELQHLQDRLFQLRCAVEDVQTAIAEDCSRDELRQVVGQLSGSVGALDRIWLSPRAT
jgi:hypothetical protein